MPTLVETSAAHAMPPPAFTSDAPVPQSLAFQLPGIFASLRRLADLQLTIWLTRIKMAAVRLLLFALCALFALLLLIIAVIFLYAGLYHVLTDLLAIPTAWALLIFAAVHMVIAVLPGILAIALLNRRGDRRKLGATS